MHHHQPPLELRWTALARTILPCMRSCQTYSSDKTSQIAYILAQRKGERGILSDTKRGNSVRHKQQEFCQIQREGEKGIPCEGPLLAFHRRVFGRVVKVPFFHFTSCISWAWTREQREDKKEEAGRRKEKGRSREQGNWRILALTYSLLCSFPRK